MNQPALVEIAEPDRQRMEHAIIRVRHRLAETGLFTDESLIAMLDRHPRELLNVYTMGEDLLEQDWRLGDSAGLSGEELMEAVRRGKLWYNLQRAAWHHAAFGSAINRAYDELEAACPGFRSFQRSAQLLISSPRAQVFYHADAPLNMLWHIRGGKRVWVYPLAPPHITQETLEGVFAPGEVGEELPYDESFDADAEVFDLEPGEMITWPQNTPHRVRNTEGVNVSISSEHYTAEAHRRQAIVLANRYYRRHLPFAFRSMELFGPGAFFKANSFRVIRRLGLVERRENNLPVSFRVDLDAPDCVQSLR